MWFRRKRLWAFVSPYGTIYNCEPASVAHLMLLWAASGKRYPVGIRKMTDAEMKKWK